MHFDNSLTLYAEILECHERSLTVTGLPFWFTYAEDDRWIISDTDIDIIDYIGTYEMGILYLSKPFKADSGKRVHITYKH